MNIMTYSRQGHCPSQIDTKTRHMRSIREIEVSSLEDAVSKVQEIVDIFLDEGLLKLKGHKFSREEQLLFTRSMGDILGWNVNSNTVPDNFNSELVERWAFEAGHSDNPQVEESGSDHYLLGWHIEQVFYIDPFLAGIWNMHHIGYEDKKAGRTFFADSIRIYDDLTQGEKDFLEKSVVIWDKPIGPDRGFGPFYTKAIDVHPNTNKKVIRLESDGGTLIPLELYQFDGRTPTDEEIEQFNKIFAELRERLDRDLDIRYEQEWDEGDVIIVDLFRMYHALTGGFGLGQRKFYATFTRPTEYTHDLWNSMELL